MKTNTLTRSAALVGVLILTCAVFAQDKAPNNPPRYLTTKGGAAVTDDSNVRTAGPRGPILLEDVWFLEKMANFDREVIPERRMHAKGSGAFGTFTVTTTNALPYCRASIFSKVGKQTPLFVRFSTVAGFRGAADLERDIRGFAVKMYTDEGNWDLVGNNTPVFFLRDPLRFPDLNHAVKTDPADGMRSARNNWDFWTLLPEALNQVTVTMSDEGIPAAFEYMNGFGSHTFSLYNKENKRTWVKFHWVCQQRPAKYYFTDAEAATINGMDRDYLRRHLYNSIAAGIFPKWKLCFQLMTEAQAKALKWNPFDLTKDWPTNEYPLVEVGVMELNRNPSNFFQDVEEAAFNPANVPEGIGFSPDKMLQGRLFAYGDAQRYRLGVNHNQIPVNQSKCPFLNAYSRDGAMRLDGNHGGETSYLPNSYGAWVERPGKRVPATECGLGDNYDERKYAGDQDFEFAGDRFRSLTKDQQQRLFENTARALGDAPEFIKARHIANCAKADPAYGAGVKAALAALKAQQCPDFCCCPKCMAKKAAAIRAQK